MCLADVRHKHRCTRVSSSADEPLAGGDPVPALFHGDAGLARTFHQDQIARTRFNQVDVYVIVIKAMLDQIHYRRQQVIQIQVGGQLLADAHAQLELLCASLCCLLRLVYLLQQLGIADRDCDLTT